MAATTFGVTLADVSPSLPFDPRSITATSAVSTSDIDGWIALAGGRFASAVRKVGLTPDGLGDDDLAVVREGIIQYVVARAVKSLAFGGSNYADAWSAYETRLSDIEARSSTLTAGTGRVPGGNIDRSNPAARSKRFGRDRSW